MKYNQYSIKKILDRSNHKLRPYAYSYAAMRKSKTIVTIVYGALTLTKTTAVSITLRCSAKTVKFSWPKKPTKKNATRDDWIIIDVIIHRLVHRDTPDGFGRQQRENRFESTLQCARNTTYRNRGNAVSTMRDNWRKATETAQACVFFGRPRLRLTETPPTARFRQRWPAENKPRAKTVTSPVQECCILLEIIFSEKIVRKIFCQKVIWSKHIWSK